MFAIVDIETTGGSPKTEKITEIAIFVHDGERLVKQFATLINPDKYIPPFITNLTGINNAMVQNAPRFHQVARQIVEITENCTFVAHNAKFDYGFVCAEFAQLGYKYERNTLCTVKLSKQIIPGKRSYSLGNLCAELGINNKAAHRAAGDALATVQLFELLQKRNSGGLI